MKIPHVTDPVSNMVGGMAQVVRASTHAATGAVNTMQMLASPVAEFAWPVVQSVAKSTGRALGTGHSPNFANRVDPPVRWHNGQRVHLDLDPLLPFPRWHEYAAVVEEPVRRIPGVAKGHVEGSLGRLVIELDKNADSDVVLGKVRDVVIALAADLALTGARSAPKVAPFADPGNPLAILMPLTAAVMDLVALSAAVTGWVTRLPAVPQTIRAAAALVNHQPRMVSLLESRLGRVGTDIALSITTAAASGLTQAVGTPLLDLACRGLQLSEAAAHQRVWRDREPQLASPKRPQAPVVPVISSAGEKSHAAGHNWTAAASNEASHLVVGGSIDAAIDTAKGSMKGPVESYVDSAANGSLIAAASALLAGGGTEDAAGAILAGVPRAAHMGQQAFAATLGRGLANAGQLVLDPGALRRLDQVKVVVIDGAALRGDHRAVLLARGNTPGWDDDRVYEVTDALLHGERAPEPDPDESPATGARLRWVPLQGPSATPVQGREHADLVVNGECVGGVDVGWEVDPYAIPLLQTAHRTGARVVLRHVAGTEDLSASVGATHPPGTPLLKLVRELRTDRGPVLLITAVHRDFASTDTLAALAIADVGVALDDPHAATPWTADIITGTDLAAAVRILSALPVARSASESSVHLAQGGTTLAGLLLITASAGSKSASPITLRRWFSPVNAAAATALVTGVVSASKVLRLPDPTPQPLTAWHALDPEIVYSRLAGVTQPLAVEPGTPDWRRRLDDLSYTRALSPLRKPVTKLARLASATRQEFADPLTPILAVGAAASAIVGSNIDALLVAGVMTVNAITGGVQRLRAEAAAAELFAEQDQLVRRVVVPAVATTRRRLEAAQHATRTVTVSAKSLRAGDVIDLAAPEVVPADARVLVAEDLEVDESLLTGESLPVDKRVDPVAINDADRASMLFEGSAIVAGHARAIVVATGVGTAAHRAISAVADVEVSAGVQARLRELTSKVLPLTLAGGAAVTGLALLRRASLRQAVADGVAIAVAAVPEGLPLVATLSQLAAAQRLTAKGALVRSPRTIEALGRVDTICFDKTGTLTENRLRVVCAVPNTRMPHDPLPDITDPHSAAVLRDAARASTQPHDGQGHTHATDEAILTAASSLNSHTDSTWSLIAEVPFESSRGYAAAIGITGNGKAPMLMLKGAPEKILPRCRFADPEADVAHAESLVRHLAEQGLRVLAVAQCSWGHDTTDDNDTDADAVDAAAHDLELVGYIGLADTARPSSRPLIEALVTAGRNVVLITGDHPITARAIAQQLGLRSDARVVNGTELIGLDEDACAELAADVQVFARVSPEQKVQIVAALQRCGQVTAMVGDGANDAAAIRMADVGIGVSGRGSSAARGAADIVLTDDDLGVLLDALVEGRSMWAGVRDAVTILVGGNVGEVVFTIIGTVFGAGRAPVGTRQLLLVNLLTDMFPALSIAVTSQYEEPGEDEYQTDEEADEARRTHQHEVLTGPTPSLDAPLMRQIVNRGVVTAAGATTAWAIGRWTPGTERRTATMGLTALVTTQLAQTLLTRRHSPLVVATALGSAGVLIGIIQTPVISQFFGCTPLGPIAWSGVITATAGATAVSVLAPQWLNKAFGIAQLNQE
ncbi:cation transport ATPase [Mycobacterium leprae Kyoto-2]|uniref:Probable cation-transporting ATPase I n=3 Tax=Mycobacterium leprae TaxID=1769 RepID=CTPI_MYCLE|nr:cation-translocating P-type ATPase [Mycobacterium leprae]O53114.1 RecName: Full=Probable cation-transporting ATPase I [Mycobacterium leprae TN]CAR72771.1 probable cation transport ATPase [Mycobacterium leprae Br4923]AWV48870.1 cation-translocating P-type ATPase [Mycobacterium leprae]OAR21092.1 HAD family hydrolase [Mycobacterium leprae 3125609]OAX71262.1 HAD family hydrolase [Mycobacterium leprae 7935681]CAA17934.1 putative cation-transporting ATPase [Mycobacterium leprae]